MSEIKSIMSLSVSNLAEQQHKALKEHVLGILKKVTTLIEKENYHEVQGYLEFSGSGDGYGQDNYFIDFGFNTGEPMDISDIIDKLSDLKNKAKD